MIVATAPIGGQQFFELTKEADRGQVEQAGRAFHIVSAEEGQRDRDAVTQAQTGKGHRGRVSDSSYAGRRAEPFVQDEGADAAPVDRCCESGPDPTIVGAEGLYPAACVHDRVDNDHAGGVDIVEDERRHRQQ